MNAVVESKVAARSIKEEVLRDERYPVHRIADALLEEGGPPLPGAGPRRDWMEVAGGLTAVAWSCIVENESLFHGHRR